jgi:hypothetical protein
MRKEGSSFLRNCAYRLQTSANLQMKPHNVYARIGGSSQNKEALWSVDCDTERDQGGRLITAEAKTEQVSRRDDDGASWISAVHKQQCTEQALWATVGSL